MQKPISHPPSIDYARIYDQLIYAPPLSEDADAYIVKDPRTGRFFRFNCQIIEVIRRLDGHQSTEQISTHTHMTIETIQAVVQRLALLNLLSIDSDDGMRVQQVRTDRTSNHHWIRYVFFVCWRILQPDRAITRIYHLLKLRYLFHQWFAILSILLVVLAVITYIGHSHIIHASIATLTNPQWIPLIWLIWFIATCLHELAHVVACKHFGGKIPAMGVGIYYFNPVFYCDISDAWLFPKRWQRLVTHSAGVIVNVLMLAIAIIIAPFVMNIPFLMVIIGSTIVTCGISSILNLNPLLRLDGYFVLVDWLKIENLRSRSLTYLMFLIRKLYFHMGMNKHYPTGKPYRTSRERHLLLLYALMSLTFMISLILFTTYHIGLFLEHYIGPIAWLCAIALTGIIFILSLWYAWTSRDPSDWMLQTSNTS